MTRTKCDLCSSTDNVQGRLCGRHRLALMAESERRRWARMANEAASEGLSTPILLPDRRI